MPRRLGLISAQQRKNSSSHYYSYGTASWVDPFPEIHGTLPEKMVYAKLSGMGVPFLFLNDVHIKIPIIGLDKYFQADFIIPSIKLIIEVQGAYWHTKQKTIKSDSYKFALYETAGYKILAWWDFDILSRLDALVASSSLLMSAARGGSPGHSSELPVRRRTKIDSSAGIRTLNERRKAYAAPRVSRRSLRKSKSFYVA